MCSDDDLGALLDRVRRLHEAKGFAHNGGDEPYFRMELLVEEVGEICRCITTGIGGLAEEHADVLIVLLGNSVSFNIDVIEAAHRKLDRLERLEPQIVNSHARLISKGGSP